jgi:hypothetical protein
MRQQVYLKDFAKFFFIIYPAGGGVDPTDRDDVTQNQCPLSVSETPLDCGESGETFGLGFLAPHEDRRACLSFQLHFWKSPIPIAHNSPMKPDWPAPAYHVLNLIAAEVFPWTSMRLSMPSSIFIPGTVCLCTFRSD